MSEEPSQYERTVTQRMMRCLEGGARNLGLDVAAMLIEGV